MAPSIRPTHHSSSPPICRCFMGDECSPPTARRAGPRHRPPRPRGGRPGGDPGHQRHRPQRHRRPAGRVGQRDRLPREDDPLLRLLERPHGRHPRVRDHQVQAVREQGPGPWPAGAAHAHGRPRQHDLAGAVLRRGDRPRDPAPGPRRRLRGLERGRRHDLLGQRPAARRLRCAAQGRLPRVQGRRSRGDRARRRARRQRLRVRRAALRQRRPGLLRRRRRPHRHGLPDHGPARVLPRAERAHRPLLLHGLPRGPRGDARARRRQARLDDRAGLAHAVDDLRARRPRRHQGRRRQPGRAGRLPDEGLRLHGQRPLRQGRRLVQPRRHQDGRHQRRAQPRPDDRLVRPQARLLRLPERRLGRRRSRAAARSTRAPRRSRSTPRPTASCTSPRCRST